MTQVFAKDLYCKDCGCWERNLYSCPEVLHKIELGYYPQEIRKNKMNDISPITEGDLIINTLDTLAELPVVDTKSSPISPEAEEVGAVQVGEGTVAGVESVVL